MRKRMATVGLAVLMAVAGGLVATAGPAAAQAASDPRPVTGNFAGGAAEELFAYFPGTAPDQLVTFAKSNGVVTTTEYPFSVSGTYTPVAGNFDGDAYDEIIWYAPGATQDYLWNFTSLTAATSTTLTVSGTFTPVAGDFTGDGTDDVYWYAPGSAADYLWDYGANGAYTSTAKPAGGQYIPVAGSFGVDATDDIFFYNTDVAGADNLWDFVAGGTTHVNRPYPVAAAYAPFALDAWGDGAGGGDIFFYAAGPDPDYRWDFTNGRLGSSNSDPVSGYYRPVVSADLFADGSDDVLWIRDVATVGGTRTINLWDHTVQGTTLVRDRYEIPEAAWTNTASGSSTTTVQRAATATVGTR